MANRICRGVLWDVHGGLLDHKVEPPNAAPAVRRAQWAARVERVLKEKGAQDADLIRENLAPLALWRRRMAEELRQPRARRTQHGLKIIPERRFQEAINVALLSWVAPSFMRGFSRKRKVQLARLLWRRRRDDQGDYTLDPEMRKLVHQLGETGIILCLVTAQDRERALRLLTRCQVPMSLFMRHVHAGGDATPHTKLYTSGMVGLPKSHPAFWSTVCELITLKPQETICIEDNPGIGCNAVRSGMGLLMYDQDGEIAAFIRDELSGKLEGAPLLGIDSPLPKQEPFVLCPSSPGALGQCLERMLLKKTDNR